MNHRIDGLCCECQNDITNLIPWTRFRKFPRDGLFARLKYCPACRDEIKRAEQDQAARRKFRRESELHKKRLAERAREREENLKLENEMTKEREKAPKNERQQIEYSRMMAECNSLAETSEKRTLEERGFDTGG